MNCSIIIPPNLEFTSETLYIVICYTLVFLLALIGNSVMFLVLFRNQRHKRKRVHLLLLHMTIAHLLVTLIYIPKEIIHNITVGWWGGDLLCRVCKFFDVFGVALSSGILMCLSLDRFYSILFPLYVINAKKSVSRMLIVAWTVSILTSLPQIYIFQTAKHPCFEWYTQCVSADVIGKILPQITFWFSVINILQVYFLPLVVILICYGSILISISLKTQKFSSLKKTTIKKNKKNSITKSNFPKKNQNQVYIPKTTTKMLVNVQKNTVNNLTPPKANLKCHNIITSVNNNNTTFTTTNNMSFRRTGGVNSFQRAKNRTLKMTVVLVLAFLLSWTPYTVAMFIHFLWHASATQRLIPPLVRKFFYAFAVFNSAISPYLYGYFLFNIKEELKLLLYYCSTCLRSCGCKTYVKNFNNASNDKRLVQMRIAEDLSSSTYLPSTIGNERSRRYTQKFNSSENLFH